MDKKRENDISFDDLSSSILNSTNDDVDNNVNENISFNNIVSSSHKVMDTSDASGEDEFTDLDREELVDVIDSVLTDDVEDDEMVLGDMISSSKVIDNELGGVSGYQEENIVNNNPTMDNVKEIDKVEDVVVTDGTKGAIGESLSANNLTSEFVNPSENGQVSDGSFDVEHFNDVSNSSIVNDVSINQDINTIVDAEPNNQDINTIVNNESSNQDINTIVNNEPSNQDINNIVNNEPINQDINTIVNAEPINQDINTIVNNEPSNQDINNIVNNEPINQDINTIVNAEPINQDINNIVNNESINQDMNNIVNNEPVMPDKVLLEGNQTFSNSYSSDNMQVNNQGNINNQDINDIVANAIYYDVATNCFIDANGNQYYNQNIDNVNNYGNINNYNGINNQNVGNYENSYKVKIVKKKPSLIHMIVNVISYTLFILLLILGIMLLFYVVDNKVKEAKGDTTPSKYNAYVVLTGSMVPTINVYDVVVTEYVDPKDLQKDDIITFWSDYYKLNVTHRIIEVYYDDTTDQYMFKTRGDANGSEDAALLTGDDVYGKVILRIPKLGYVQNFLAKDGGWIIVILIPCLAILSYDIMKLFKMAGNKTKVLK